MSKLRVGITGQSGFVGYHIWHSLIRQNEAFETIPFEDAFFDDEARLESFVASCDAIVHLAAMNRGNEEELYRTNVRLVEMLVAKLEKTGNRAHVLFSSSIQEVLDNPYGRSKREGRALLEQWASRTGGRVSTLVIPNVFGPFCRPRYNSVVATFCHQLTHGETPSIHVDADVKLIYVNDLAALVLDVLRNPSTERIREIQVPYGAVRKVSDILAQLQGFREKYLVGAAVPHLPTAFDVALFNTFRSYIDLSHFPVRLQVHTDARGYLCETVKTQTEGQTFFSVTKPGITRGNHYHTRKIERFTVIQGEAVIRLRKIGSSDVQEFHVSGDQPSFVDMPVSHTHNIQNVGSSELLTLFWSNEIFNPQDSDTYFENV